MDGKDITQKQISEKYKGSLDYFRRGHYLRRLRLGVFLLAVVVSIGLAVGFRYWGSPELMSTGPLSANHARFANDCQVCHEGADVDLLRLVSSQKMGSMVDKVRGLSAEGVKSSAMKMAGELGGSAHLLGLAEKGLSYSSLELMDRSCLKCHQPMGDHQPQLASLSVRGALKEVAEVHADACSSCHREHVGHQRMGTPGSETCATCHNQPAELKRTRGVLPLPQGIEPKAGETRDLGDGLLRFLTPPAGAVKPFASYAEGHPAFAYEAAGMKDPARIKYNHARHELGDIPDVNGHKLGCADCHQPAANGVYYQPVNYEKHCQTCHSLHLMPDFPELKIPHGDADKVRYFLGDIRRNLDEALRIRGVDDKEARRVQIDEQSRNFGARGMTTTAEIEKRVFFTGDPPQDEARNAPKSNKVPFFAGCAKCHELESGANNAPQVLPTMVAQRWVQRGPFTHVPHVHMDCLDCHGAAKTSKLTSDILMPTQRQCAECHRPPDLNKLEDSMDTIKMRAALNPDSHLLADAQKRSGGVRSECLDCHAFHSSASALVFVNEQKAAAAAKQKGAPANGAQEAKGTDKSSKGASGGQGARAQ